MELQLAVMKLTNSKVAYTLGNNQISNFATADGTTLTLNQVSPNSALTIYKHNAIPYIAPLYWQNDTITGDRYLLVNQVTMGKAVDANRTIGDIVLNEGTTILDSNGTIQIHEGTIIEDEAHLILKNNGSVAISGGTIKNGGKLTVLNEETTNGTIQINEGLVVEEDAHLILKNSGLAMINGGIIQNGGKLTIEGTGEVMIYGGIIRNGGILNLEGPGKVIVIGGIVKSGGILNTDCEVEFVGEFEIKENANVELK